MSGRQIPDRELCHHREGAGHDCTYVDQRNRVIGVAWGDAVRETNDGPDVVRRFLAIVNRRMNKPDWSTVERAKKEGYRGQA